MQEFFYYTENPENPIEDTIYVETSKLDLDDDSELTEITDQELISKLNHALDMMTFIEYNRGKEHFSYGEYYIKSSDDFYYEIRIGE